MARKKTTSRPNIPQETLNRARQQAGQSPITIEEAKPQKKSISKTKAETPTKKTTTEDLANEYAYVVTDLRNMAILAAALFMFLVVLALTL